MRRLLCPLVLLLLVACGEDSNSPSGVDESVAYPMGQICLYEEWDAATSTYTYSEDALNYSIEVESTTVGSGPVGDGTDGAVTFGPYCVEVTWDQDVGNWSGYTVYRGTCDSKGAIEATVSIVYDDSYPSVVDRLGQEAVGGGPVFVSGPIKTVVSQGIEGDFEFDYLNHDPLAPTCDNTPDTCRYTFCDGTISTGPFPDGT